jgi:predicted nuclease with TOPRIM domain
VELFDQLEKKVQARAEERTGLLQENERLRQEISRQAKEMKRLKSELSEDERIEQEVKDRVDNLISFLEALPALKD